MRIAVDIDSTLHHYWDRLSAAALRRFGIDLPYEEQFDWGITRLKPEQLQLCIDETHCEQVIIQGRLMSMESRQTRLFKKYDARPRGPKARPR